MTKLLVHKTSRLEAFINAHHNIAVDKEENGTIHLRGTHRGDDTQRWLFVWERPKTQVGLDFDVIEALICAELEMWLQDAKPKPERFVTTETDPLKVTALRTLHEETQNEAEQLLSYTSSLGTAIKRLLMWYCTITSVPTYIDGSLFADANRHAKEWQSHHSLLTTWTLVRDHLFKR